MTTQATPEIYTCQQYMQDSQVNGTAAHRKYFGQFVNSSTIARVVNDIGKDKILASTNPHMNDIPLALWDRLAPQLPGSAGFAKAGDYYTRANGVCLAKEAALQWKEQQAQGEWKHCSPELLNSGVSCRDTPRRPCECDHGGSHDHWIAHP